MDIKLLGEKIKTIRINKGLSIKDLADKIEVSSSLLSQIERGLANPSLNTLRLISTHLDVPMFSFFADEAPLDTKVVRKEQRIRIINGKTDSEEIELGYDLLSPDVKGTIQLCEMTLGPHQYSADKLNIHNGEEVAVCTQESIELHLENEILLLNNGDSIRIDRGIPHRWKNPTDKTCTIIFAISPPNF